MMKTFYSILYIPLNAALEEKISIGILIWNGEDYIFKYSCDKLNAIKGIINTEKVYIVKSYLKSLEEEINSKDKTSLFRKELSNSSGWINKNYLSYLSKYSNTIIQFSSPKAIDVDFNESNFRKIFEKYVFKYDIDLRDDERITDIISLVKRSLYLSIKENVNIDITLTSSDFENLFAPIEVSFFGMNGIPVVGQTFDFDKRHYYLENDVTRYISLTKALELEGKKNGKYFVLGREPNKSNTKSHSMWEHIRNSEFLEFVDFQEYGIIEEYIKENEVKPYFEIKK